jgi:uncharacterized protein YlzI (FlbEa/FlbD family)
MKLLRCEIADTDLVVFLNVAQIVSISEEKAYHTAIVMSNCNDEERYIIKESVQDVISRTGMEIV